MNNIIKDIESNNEKLSKIVLSDSCSEIKKIIIRPVNIKGKRLFQIERYKGSQVFHENVELADVMTIPYSDYK